MQMNEMPEYMKPPVNEVAIGVQFAPLSDFRAAYLGRYWDKIRDEFPKIDERPPLPHWNPDQSVSLGQEHLRIQMSQSPDLPRTWFLTEEGCKLIQLQRDHFVFNWRKMQVEPGYPRYPQMVQDFERHWEEFEGFLDSVCMDSPDVELLELTYVNLIPVSEGWNDIADIGSIFLPFAWKSRSAFLPKPDRISASLAFSLPEQQGQLRVDIKPVATSGRPLQLRLTLSARGYPNETGDIQGWLDMAHEWIVKGFVDLTSPETDTLWGRAEEAK